MEKREQTLKELEESFIRRTDRAYSKATRTSRLSWLSFSILIIVIVYSCSNALFNQPQPVNAKNLKKIPQKLNGIWIDNRDTIVIGKTSYKHVSFFEDHITRAAIDTSKDFKMVDNKLFPTVEDPEIMDFKYILKNDTFFYSARYVDNFFCLSDSLLLRKAGQSYVCSVKRGNWWELFIIQKEKNGEIKIYYPDANVLKDNQQKYGINQIDTVKVKTEDKLYFQAQLNKDFFEKNINDNLLILYVTLFPDSTYKLNK